jgi:hypothetical protein
MFSVHWQHDLAELASGTKRPEYWRRRHVTRLSCDKLPILCVHWAHVSYLALPPCHARLICPTRMSLVSIKAPDSPIPDLYFASVGFVIALIFGTQKNVFISLGLWLKTVSQSTLVWLKTTSRPVAFCLKGVIESLKFWRNRGLKRDRGLLGWRRRETVVDLA